ncbi:hypothetical protein K6U06_19215 [Acidiferrimicrobium sp. IK]|uniref:hypothetical protein n=1 Tax=Acidiferrimicrobium sp. IK TaxID=2871700 RepID=UPI0021CB3930|nr:hypothetical protein [Acidiferrimicrobium sp. IK]MCU4186506.1 hypothetical protein [Acidiferrimicrobium sp. IK]
MTHFAAAVPVDAAPRQPERPAPGARAARLSRTLVVFAAAVVVDLFRPINASQRFSLFGEDSSIFIQQSRANGILHSFTTIYAGYYHAVPRIASAIASALPLSWTPPIFAMTSVLVAAFVAAVAYECGLGVGLSTPSAAVLAGTVLLLPASGFEISESLTYVQWYCEAGAVVFIVAWAAGHTARPLPVAVLLAVATLTSPLIPLTAPVIAVVTYRRRRPLDVAVVAGVGIGTVLQAYGHFKAHDPTPLHLSPRAIFNLFTVRTVDASAVGLRFDYTVYHWLALPGAAALGAVIFVGLALLALRARPPGVRPLMLVCLGLSLWLLAIGVILRDLGALPDLAFVLNGPDRAFPVASRYFGPSGVLLVMAVLVYLDSPRRRPAPPDDGPAPAVNGGPASGVNGIAATAVNGTATASVNGTATAPVNGGRVAAGWLRARPVVLVYLATVLVLNVPLSLSRAPLSAWEHDVAAARSTCVRTGGASRVVVSNAPGPVWKIDLTCEQAFGIPDRHAPGQRGG